MKFSTPELELLIEAMNSLDYSGCSCDDDRTDRDNLLMRLEKKLQQKG